MTNDFVQKMQSCYATSKGAKERFLSGVTHEKVVSLERILKGVDNEAYAAF